MNTKNNKRYKNNSEKIETAFLALLLKNEYDDISISQVCKQADINRSTFYAHYDDINDLIVKIESNFANSMATIFGFGLKQNHEAFVQMFEFVKKNKSFYKAFLKIPYTTFAEKQSKSIILSNIKDNMNFNSIELQYRSSFFGAGFKEICRLWLARDCAESPQFMADLLKKEYLNRADDVLKGSASK